jgi:predicted acetyltransferase
MTLVASHKTQLDSVTIQQPIDSQLMYYFGFNNKISVSLKPFMMARIVDVKYVLEKLAKDMILDLSIRINDGILSQNNQVFHIKNGSVAISDNKADAIMDIGTLTQLYMGTVSVSAAYDLGKIEAENINLAQLNRLFSYKISYVNEYI